MNFVCCDVEPANEHQLRRDLVVLVLAAIIATVGVGCSPAQVPVPNDIRLNVAMPNDAARIGPDGIQPPQLDQLDPPHAVRTVAMRMYASPLQGGGGQVEVVPAPEPDSDAPAAEPTIPATPKPETKPEKTKPTEPKPDMGSDKNSFAAKKETSSTQSGNPEIIPTPEGVPIGGMNDSAKVDTPTEPEKSATSEKMVENAAKDGQSDPEATAKDDFPGIDGPEDYRTWDQPLVALVVTGQQHGYIEPCGCTGLDRQKGGVARRFTFLKSLRDDGWDIVPLDAGNQVRRFGRQSAIKLQQTVRALDEMGYKSVGFGPDDIRLGVGDLLAVAAGEDDSMYASANVVLIDPSLVPQTKLIERNGLKVGVSSVLDPESLEVDPGSELLVQPMVDSAKTAIEELSQAEADYKVLLFFGKEAAAESLMQEVAGFDLIVVAGGYGEPTFQAASIKDSATKMIVTGDKGMYTGLVGLYSDRSMKYARIPLTDEFADAPEMRQLMKDYQDQLRDVGLKGLGLLPPIPHSSGDKFTGSKKCGECHTTAFDIWESSAHAEATEHLVVPPKERSDIARHFDPECLSCHVTGWNPQEYYPYESGYLSLEASAHLTGNGCENCHGPGDAHVKAEEDDQSEVALRDQLREAMRLPLEKAREKCMTCHDLDNSPDFHEKDAFEDIYWPEVEHYGTD